jgi:hypothetical protein
MIRAAILVCCLIVSYFIVFLILSGYWGKALMTGILAAPIFSATLFAASFSSRGRPWRAFWIANIALALIFGGAEVYAGLTLKNPHLTRFGGAQLWIDGEITGAGLASLAFDIAICMLSNFIGFYAYRRFVERFNLK